MVAIVLYLETAAKTIKYKLLKGSIIMCVYYVTIRLLIKIICGHWAVSILKQSMVVA